MPSTLNDPAERQPWPLESARLGVLGPGRLGASLARELVAAGLHLVGVAGGAPGRAERLAQALARSQPGPLAAGGEGPVAPVAMTADALLGAVDVLWLTVPDDRVASLCAGLPFRAGQLVVHCSGALELSALAAARDRGATVGCMHPLQSFSNPDGELGRLRGVSCGVQAEPPHDAWLAALCARLGANALSLAGVDPAGYHAAAVFASNYLVALYAAAERAFAGAGLPPEAARRALLALSRGTLDNLALRPPVEALTGPLARGDASSVAAHVRALSADPVAREAYRALARVLLELPLAHDPAVRAALERALQG